MQRAQGSRSRSPTPEGVDPLFDFDKIEEAASSPEREPEPPRPAPRELPQQALPELQAPKESPQRPLESPTQRARDVPPQPTPEPLQPAGGPPQRPLDSSPQRAREVAPQPSREPPQPVREPPPQRAGAAGAATAPDSEDTATQRPNNGGAGAGARGLYVQRIFCEAVQVLSTARGRGLDAFGGLEWCLAADGDNLTPMGRVMRGRWQDVEGAVQGVVLLHGLPSGRPLLLRGLEDCGNGATRAGRWVRVTTRPVPADAGSQASSYDLLGRQRGGIPGLCSGWIRLDKQDTSALPDIQADRCLRCGDIAGRHALVEKENQASQAIPAATDAEQYVVVVKPCVSVFSEPDHNSQTIRNFLYGEYVWLYGWDKSKRWRRCICEGKPERPEVVGWVMPDTIKYGSLLVPQNERKLRELCHADTSGVMSSLLHDFEQERSAFHEQKELVSEINNRISDKRDALRARTLGGASYIPRSSSRPRLEVSDGRLVLGPRQRPPGARRRFSQALVMGAHHTCTTALALELARQFKVEVVNDYDGILSPDLRPDNYKHRVLRSPPLPADALIICLVKEPFFWLQSLSRHGAIYAVKPVVDNPVTGEFQDRDLQLNVGICDLAQDKLLDILLEHVEFLGDVYEGGALGVWEATVRSYFDPVAYPLERTAVVRAEDFLFNFDAVMQSLGDLGLERRERAPPPTEKPVKAGVMHPHTRGRPEALKWYGAEENRFVGFKPRHTHVIFERLGPELLKPLRYWKGAAPRWVHKVEYPPGVWSDSEEAEEGEASAEGPGSRPVMWLIIGGEDKGGVLVRDGPGLASKKASERLSTGALVEELALLDCGQGGERLHFRRMTGTGPAEGWISVALNHKILAERVDAAPAESAEPG